MSLRNVIFLFPNIAIWPLAAVLLLAVGSPSLQTQDHAPQDRTYYFPHIAVGASWQTTITYINDSPREVTCRTDFISDDGSPLTLSFPELGAVAGRTDVLPPGGIVHEETNLDFSAPLAPGWARATCSEPVKASLLFRRFNGGGAPAAEAGVRAATVPATRFITFAEQGEGKTGTGVAYANPSSATTLVTLTARDASGQTLASEDLTLPPGGHGAQDMASLFGLTGFSGSLEVTSTEPIVSLSLNFEADPVFSSLPPGEPDASGQGSTTYYFPHLAVGASWQTTVTYINDSPREVTCRTDFISDYGSPLMVSFPDLGTVVDRTDVLPPGGTVHEETNVELNAPLAPGWARAACSGPVKASLLFRRHSSQGAPTGEAGLKASTVPATRFITFAEQGEGKTGTGVAYANPSATSALVTLTARDAAGQVLASVDRSLLPGGHEAHGMATLFGLPGFMGSLEVTSTEPIVSLSLNFEADPVFSSLPPGATVDISGAMLAPANEAAFNDLLVEKRLATDDAASYVDFVSPGRFRKTEGANTRTGSYSYESTSVNTGTITYDYDDGDRCTENLTFVSPTSGTATRTCSDGSRGESSWRVAAMPSSEKADLVVQAPSVGDSSPNAEESFTLNATVHNQGDGRSDFTTLRYYRSADATITTSDTEVGTDAVAELGASGSSSESVEMAAPGTAGTYYYGACVDAVTDESDTANNCSSSVTVTVTQPVYPDLEVGVPSVSNNSPVADASITLSATVSNTGDGESAATTLRYYRSTDATITTADTAVGTDAVAELAAAGSSSKSVDLTAPASPGAYYYGACVDAVTEESDMTNNCSTSVEVTVVEKKEETQGQPDLAVGTPAVDESNPAAGAGFTLSATVSNTGDGESEATTLRYYRSADATITTADAAEGTGAVGALSASGSSAESISLTAPETAGTYYYGACVDTVTEESDTTNNCSTSVTVTVPQPVYPDLEVGTPTVSDGSPAVGAGFTLSATVSNTGDGESEATTLRYYQSTDATITTADTGVGTDAVGALSALGSSAESISLTAPETAGTYYYGACVDAVTEESDTTNNCSSSVTVTVPQPVYPDLEVGAPTVSDGSPAAGAGFTLSATVSNAADGESEATTLRYYQSADATITTTDTAVGTDAVGGLPVSGTSGESISLTAPETAGTYYYGACVDPVTDESDTTNNCSSAVELEVEEPQSSTPSVEVTAPKQWAPVGGTVTYTARVLNADGDEIQGASVAWSSTNTGVATVDGNGVATAVAEGTASVTATATLTSTTQSSAEGMARAFKSVAVKSANTVTGSADMEVVKRAESVVVAPSSLSFDGVGETADLTATVYDADGEEMKPTYWAWGSDNNEVAKVEFIPSPWSLTNRLGIRVKAIGEGTTSVSMTANGSATGSASVTVTLPEQRVEVSPGRLRFDTLGDSKSVDVTVLDEEGEEDADATFTWSSSFRPGTGTSIGDGGLDIETADGGLSITANQVGTAQVTISSGDAEPAILLVYVSQRPVSLEVSPDSVSLAVDGTTTLSASAEDANGHPVQINDGSLGNGGLVVSWETGDAAVATVDGVDDYNPSVAEGARATVTAVKAGTATITGKHGSLKDTATVTVTDNN